jgi:hypothetical protein
VGRHDRRRACWSNRYTRIWLKASSAKSRRALRAVFGQFTQRTAPRRPKPRVPHIAHCDARICRESCVPERSEQRSGVAGFGRLVSGRIGQIPRI